MGDGDGGVRAFGNEEHGHWFANDHGAADNDGFRALSLDAGDFQQFHATCRGAGDEAAGVFEDELGDVFRVETIDVFAWVDGADDGRLIDVGGRR